MFSAGHSDILLEGDSWLHRSFLETGFPLFHLAVECRGVEGRVACAALCQLYAAWRGPRIEDATTPITAAV